MKLKGTLKPAPGLPKAKTPDQPLNMQRSMEEVTKAIDNPKSGIFDHVLYINGDRVGDVPAHLDVQPCAKALHVKALIREWMNSKD